MAAPNRSTLFDPTVAGAQLAHTPGVGEIFLAFLSIGATSFGGGVMAYLRSSMVEKHRWLNDRTFVELMVISQMVPGLKAVNLAVLIGDRLRGITGALAALLGICLPGAFLMYVVGIVYQIERDRPLLDAALEGVAPAAVGLLLATVVELGRKSLAHVDDVVFVALTVICVNRLHMHVVSALLGVGILAAFWYGVVRRTQTD
jgi:chromate transporter